MSAISDAVSGHYLFAVGAGGLPDSASRALCLPALRRRRAGSRAAPAGLSRTLPHSAPPGPRPGVRNRPCRGRCPAMLRFLPVAPAPAGRAPALGDQAAFLFTSAPASRVRIWSVSFSSCRVASSSGTASLRPSWAAQVFRVP